MGKANVRLNPRVSQSVRKNIVELACGFLKPILQERFKESNKSCGRRGAPQQHESWVKALCLLLKILCVLTWDGYEAQIRSRKDLCSIIGVGSLPSKTVVFEFEKKLPEKWLRTFLWYLVKDYCRADMWVACDSTGIALVKRSAWYCLRLGKKLLRRENLKLHILQDLKYGLVVNAEVTLFNKNDSPILRFMLKPFKTIGAVLADAAYTCRKTMKLVVQKKGFMLSPFKSNHLPKAKGCMAWTKAYWFWKNANWIFKALYHKRSKIESAFSSIKRSFGSSIRTRQPQLYTKEILLVIIAYNIRQILYIKTAKEKNLQLWIKT